MTKAQNNAQLRRHAPEVIAEDIRRVLADPQIGSALDRYEQNLVDTLASAQHDGSPEFENWEREICRTLRTLRRFRYGLNKTPQLDDLRAAGFQSSPAENAQTQEQSQPYQPGIKDGP